MSVWLTYTIATSSGSDPSGIGVYELTMSDRNAVHTVHEEKEGLENLSAILYNCLDPFPGPTDFDLFLTNPPWGPVTQARASRFSSRGIEAEQATMATGSLLVVDDPELEQWPKQVLAKPPSSVPPRNPGSTFMALDARGSIATWANDAPSYDRATSTLRALPGNARDTVSMPITDASRKWPTSTVARVIPSFGTSARRLDSITARRTRASMAWSS